MTVASSTQNTYRVLTGPGPAAIAIIALRGPRVAEFCLRHLRFASGRELDVRRATLVDDLGEPLDEIVVTAMSKVAVSLHVHGNPLLVRRCSALCEAGGLTPSDALQPFFAGLDCLEQEAATLAPAMLTRRGLAWLSAQPQRLRTAVVEFAALSDPTEAARRSTAIIDRLRIVEWFARPLRVAVVGPPNVGKSTLVNAIVDHPVSIASPKPGTTRDFVEALDEVDGFPVAWLDTAGLRETGDALERAGIERSREIAAIADLVVLVLDSSIGDLAVRVARSAALTGRAPDCIVANKCDLMVGDPRPAESTALVGANIVCVSASQRTGLAELGRAVLAASGRVIGELDRPAAFTARHSRLFEHRGL